MSHLSLRVAEPAVRLISVFLPGFLVACLCAGCTKPPPPVRQPVTLRIGVPTPVSDARSGLANIEGNLATESLLGIAWDGRPTAKLASEWEWLEDRLGLRLKLHPSIKFHDGTQLDAELVRTILPDIISRAPAGTYVSLKSVTRIDAEDARTVVLHLSQPEAFLLPDLASLAIEHPKNPSLGTGPYMRVPVDGEAAGDNGAREVARLAAFNDYYRGKPEIDFVELSRYEEQRSAWAALLRGNIDAVHEVSPSAIDFVEKQTTVKTFPFTRPYFIQLLFSMQHPVLKQTAVRQALSYAVDRQRLVDIALNGRGVPAEGPIWPMHWAHSTARKTYGLNREAATLMLDAAGFKTMQKTRPGAMPSRFSFTCLTLANEARFEKIANLLQKQLADIGVDMQVEAVPYKAMGPRIAKGQFDALLIERTSGRSLVWTYLTYHSSMTPFGYRAADAVLDRLRRATTDEEMRLGVSDLQDILHDDPPALFLMWPIVARAVSTKFVVPGEAGRDVMGSLWQWRPAPPQAP